MIDEISGIPIIESSLLPEGTAFLIVKDKGMVKQIIEVYNESKGRLQGSTTAGLILELERRSKCSSCANNDSGERCDCIWYCRYDNYKPRPTTEPLPDQTKGEGL